MNNNRILSLVYDALGYVVSKIEIYFYGRMKRISEMLVQDVFDHVKGNSVLQM